MLEIGEKYLSQCIQYPIQIIFIIDQSVYYFLNELLLNKMSENSETCPVKHFPEPKVTSSNAVVYPTVQTCN